MTVAFILLAHEHLEHAAALADALAAGGRPVAVHIDARADAAGFRPRRKVIEIPRRRARWGMFGLVEATLDGAAALLASGRDFSHVMLVSGADLPLRPLAELDAFAAAHPTLDLIEADPPETRAASGGLGAERFTLFHPFCWRDRRRLFDACVALQRRLRVRRRPPAALDPAIGAQWWLLSRRTLRAILSDPQLPAIERFFRTSWIPDESLIQSLARRHARNRRNLSPTLARFDAAGRPIVFYDGHEALLARSDHFFVRKIHPRAARLRPVLLARAADPARDARFLGRAPEAAFAHAAGPARLSPASFPAGPDAPRLAAARPYLVVGGLPDPAAARLAMALSEASDLTCHGRLFAGPNPARDLWPEQFVINLAGAGRAGFHLTAEDAAPIADFLAHDPGARIFWLRGGWALSSPPDLRAATAAAAAERAALQRLRAGGAALTVRSAADLVDNPAAVVADILHVANAMPKAPAEAPQFAPDRARLRALRRAGCDVEAGLT